MRFIPHSKKQEEIFLSEKRITIAATGIQWGKSIVGVMRLINSMFTFTQKDDNFLVTSPTYKILYQSTLPVFMSYMKDWGKFDKKNELYTLHNGGTVFFRTGQNPDSPVGITNVRHILCDEAGLYSLYFWQNIQARSSIKSCPITIVTSPYSMNWLWTDYIRKYQMGDEFINDLCLVIQARSDENLYFPRGEYELKQKTMEARRFNMIYGGNFDRAQGLVYDCFNPATMAIAPIKLPPGTRFFGGIDWGGTDPFVFKVRAVTDEGMHYSVDEHYQTQMHQSDILDTCCRLRALWNVEKWYADSSRADHISFLNTKGITVIGATHPVEKGIEDHYELIASGSYCVFKAANKYTLDEYEMYHYPEPTNLKADQNQKRNIDMPVDNNNHCMDVERYITYHTKNIGMRKNRIASAMENIVKAQDSNLIHYDTERDTILRKKRKNADLSL